MLINILHNYYQISHLPSQYDLSKQEEGVTQTPLMLGSVVEYQVRILIPNLTESIYIY